MTAGGDRHRESVGAYVLGALPELERQAFERHLMGCGECRDEVERLQPAVDALPRSVTQLPAPAALRRRLMEEVEGELATAGARTGGTRTSDQTLGRLARARNRAARTLRRARPAVAWASAAFLLAAGILVGWGATRLLGDDGQTYVATVEQSALADGSGTLLVSEGEDSAVLRVHGLPALPSPRRDEVYQLWLVRGEEVVPAALMSVGRDGTGSATVSEGVDQADAVWVTRERVGGARAPTERPVMRVEIG